MEHGSGWTFFWEIIALILELFPMGFAAQQVWLHHRGKHSADDENKIPFYTLQLLVAFSVTVLVEGGILLMSIHSKTAKIEQSMVLIQNQTALIQQQKEIIEKLEANTSEMKICNNRILNNVLYRGGFDSIRKRIDPVLNSVFNKYLLDETSFFRDAIDGHATVRYSQVYMDLYISSLEYFSKNFNKPEFRATSIPDTNYLWSSHGDLRPLEKEIQHFNQHHGSTFIRIFFVNQNYLKDPTVVAILRRQVDSMHVQVWVTDEQQAYDKGLVAYYVLAGQNGQNVLMWNSQISSNKKIKETNFTTNADMQKEFRENFNLLLSNSKEFK